MSLKGYQWLNENGEVIMYYMFKDEEIFLNKDVTSKQHREFVKFIEGKGFKVRGTNCKWHTITFEEFKEED